MKCLIVEDNFVARTLLLKYLSKVGDCHTAVNGAAAMAAFADALGADDPFDLVCLDIMMPEMDGHEVLRRMRQTEEQHGIQRRDGVKVIVTSALGDSKNVQGALHQGCEAYIVKPVSKQQLFNEIHNLGLSTNAACVTRTG